MSDQQAPAIPRFHPGEAAVAAAVNVLDPLLPLPAGDPGVTAYWRQKRANVVLGALDASAQHIAADVFEWLFRHHKDLGITGDGGGEKLLDLAVEARKAADVSQDDPT